jgi:signal transduction histidine kinase
LLKIYQKKGKKEEVNEFIDLAHQSAKQSLSLLDDLSTWARDQQTGIKFKPVLVDIKQLLIDEIKFIEAGAKLKNIMVLDDIKTEKHVLADIEMVKTIVRNLINNALKFSLPKGKIVVSAHCRGTFIEVSIKDTGKGISPKGQKRLFLEKDSRITYGTGLEKGTCKGLLMCKEFIDLHGGEIKVESKQGKGSDFKFTLPHMPYDAAKMA